jgi:hypothetical protein
MRGGVTFDALGGTWEAKFTTNAICRVEERSGRGLEDVLADVSAPGKRTLAYRLLLWAALGGVTIEAAGEIMDDLGMVEVDRIISAALRAAFPVPDGDAGNGEATAG